MGVGGGLLRRWPLTGSRSWSSAEMATKPKTELVFGGGWRRSPSRSSSSAVDGDSQKVGDGDEAQVGARLRRWMATKRKGTKLARMGEENPREIRVDRCNSRQIFVSGLAKDTTHATFNKHFGSYGEITGSVIVKDRYSGQPRGFGFVTYADPSVVDKVIEDNHIINGKQAKVKIKRIIPKRSGQSKDFKTKKIFVGGVPSSVTEDEFKNFFSKYGEVVEHQIIRDHETNRSRVFGFIVFDSEEVVDEILSNGNMIDMAGTQVTLVPWFSRNQDVGVFMFVQVNVKIKKAEPKKALNPPPAPAYGSNSRARSFDGGFGGYGSSYGYDDGFVPGPYRTPGGLGGRFGAYGGYGSGGSEFGGYGGFGSSSLGGYRGGSSLGYSSGFGPYGGGFSGGYGGSGLGGYGRGEGYSSNGGSSYEWLRLQFWF